ncbi:1-acyl-sn-glycerol-3-phosphate acyltransferase [Bacillus timonensis]|nr:1-acyl-sn-glycerol-3-phosphate acyltransferase [Bacillus timonensis]
MVRTVLWFLFFGSYLIYSIPSQLKLKKLDKSLSVEERDLFIHKLPKKWASYLIRIAGVKVTVTGRENIPNGPVLFVANHQGNFDIPILLSCIDKPFGFISKVEVKKLPIIRSWMELMNCVFIDRKDRRQSLKAIKEGISLLKDGHSMVIFPEGTRSKDGKVKSFKTGGLRLAVDSNVPIVPIVIDGSYKIMEQNKGIIKPAKVNITILPAHFHSPEKETKELAELIQQKISAKLN